MTVKQRLAEASVALTALGFPSEQTNDRSARVLLTLLGMGGDSSWSDATNPRLGTHAMIAWIRDLLDFEYAPNSRETIRRQTLHQFVSAGLVIYNEDDPGRPTNSSRNNYRITPEGLELLKTFGTPGFDAGLPTYLAKAPGLSVKYAAARAMTRIPVTLPDGTAVTLGGGGQNVLIKEMVEEFCAIFTPGGHILYLGDADEKLATYKEKDLEQLGVVVESHGKMPDLVVYDSARNWLVLMEAASTHGPVDSKRHAELAALFADSTAGLVYVSCFPDKATMRKYLTVLAWETEVWLASDPTHLIHLNGDKFLGPYTAQSDPA